jgi:hypothetical protein
MAAGLTVDELRAVLDEILGKIHREPRTVIVPTSTTANGSSCSAT